MKTKVLFSTLLLALVVSCVKDYHGGGEEEPYEGILTETNYLYFDDFRTAFLENRIMALDAEIEELNDRIGSGQGDAKDEERLEEAKNERTSNQEEIDFISEYREQVFRVRPMPPPPPCPSPQSCTDWLDIVIVTPPPTYTNFQLIIYSENQEVIAETDGNPEPLDGLDGLLNFVNLNWYDQEYRGSIFIQVFTEDQQGNLQQSFIDSRID
ncbi:hypothetical protein FK220_019025 [Flavobacteriaceae bacterium TP-CH-4]|uniref:Uncharacterized protein n=1 Tax=Pelagihabitans pacificus TaxID=2696054 RepID=A0A967AW13_9FLAO|nr:hypothetical protein [Pelagihabitans pacificus]NHF61454.1 hypothetical protein [Pelagihabitans pacificus]